MAWNTDTYANLYSWTNFDIVIVCWQFRIDSYEYNGSIYTGRHDKCNDMCGCFGLATKVSLYLYVKGAILPILEFANIYDFTIRNYFSLEKKIRILKNHGW